MTETYSPIATVQRYYTNGVKEGAQLPFNFELMKQLRAYSKAQDIVVAVNSWLDPMPKGHFTNWVVS
jgi:alpha-glucosidase